MSLTQLFLLKISDQVKYFSLLLAHWDFPTLLRGDGLHWQEFYHDRFPFVPLCWRCPYCNWRFQGHKEHCQGRAHHKNLLESTILVHVMGLGKKTRTLLSWMYAKLLLSCLTLCYSIHGMLQARILEWAAMPSSRDQPYISCTSCISDGFFNSESQGKPPSHHNCDQRMPPTIPVNKGYEVTKPMCTLRGFRMERNTILP